MLWENNGRRYRFLLFAAFLQLIFFVSLCEANETNQIPFFLIPVSAKSGTSTKTTECIGTLISPRHILSPASCLYFHSLQNPWKLASGIFIDFRKDKKYSQKKNNFPIDHLFFSKNIKIHPDFNNETLANDVALITLAKSFKKSNSLNIVPTPIQPNINSLDQIHVLFYKRESASTNVFHTFASIDDNVATKDDDSIAFEPPSMVFIRKPDFSYNLIGFINVVNPDGTGKFVAVKNFCQWIQELTKVPCLSS